MDFREFWDSTFENFDYVLGTDGGWYPHVNLGGWVCLLLGLNGEVRELSGTEEANHMRMELLAALTGIEETPEGSRVLLITDSQYVQNIIEDWMFLWEAQGWRRTSIKNQDIIKQLLVECNLREVEILRVESHTKRTEGPYNLNRYVDGRVTDAIQGHIQFQVQQKAKYRKALKNLLQKRESTS